MSSHDPISLFGLNSDLVKDDYIGNIITSDSKNKIDPLEAYTGFIDKIKNEELNSVDLNLYDSNNDQSLYNDVSIHQQTLEQSNIFGESVKSDNYLNNIPIFDNTNTSPFDNYSKFDEKMPSFDSNIFKKPIQKIETINSVSNDDLYNKNPILGQSVGIKNYSYETNNLNTDFNNTNNNTNNNQIDSIIDNYSSFNEQKHPNEDKTYESEIDDKKLILLEKIQNLRDLLAKEEVNLENVPMVNYNSSISEIQYTYRILMIKNNRDLNIDLTGNVIKGMSKVLEKVFDGKKSYFGVTLDLTGYTDTVDIQLRRLDVETEKIAGNFMNKTELNPYYKIGLYLIPGMIAHSVLKRKRQNDTIYDNDKLIDALNDIKHN
mgnify:FL=1